MYVLVIEMKDPWIINYKRHCYQLDNGEKQVFKIFVTSDTMRFKLELEDYSDSSLLYITKSNSLQLLKDLVHSIQNNVGLDRINNHFKMLDLSNLTYLMQKINET